MYHEHPVRILKYSAKNIWLLIFPLLRALYSARFRFNKEWFYDWVRGAWFDLAVVGAIILFGFIRWYFSTIDFTEEELIHRDGVFIRINTFIPYKNISSATVERPMYLLPIRAMRFRCDTRAGIMKTVDMKLTINQKTCNAIMERLPDVADKDKISGIPKPTVLSVLLFSVFFSSGFSGTLYIATFFFKGGDIAHDIISLSLNRLTEETTKLTERLLLRIPAAALIIGIFFITSWLLSFIVNVFRYAGFRIESDGKCLKIAYGIFDRKEYRISVTHINYTDLRQNLIMKLFRAVAVNISCPGYGSTKNRLPVLLPIKREKSLGRDLEAIGVFSGVKNDFRPEAKGIGSYLLIPLIIAAEIYPTHDLAARLFPEFSELSKFMAIMLEIPAVWFIIVKFVALLTSGISIYDDKIMVRCSVWTGFHTIIAGRDRVAKLAIEQNYLQKLSKRCAVCIWFEGEEHKMYKVKAMSVRDTVKIAEMLEYDIGDKIRT